MSALIHLYLNYFLRGKFALFVALRTVPRPAFSLWFSPVQQVEGQTGNNRCYEVFWAFLQQRRTTDSAPLVPRQQLSQQPLQPLSPGHCRFRTGRGAVMLTGCFC